MNYGGERSVRRARTRTAQSCEMVGLLPAEEIALKKALMASLSSPVLRTKAKDRVITVRDSSDEEDHASPGENSTSLPVPADGGVSPRNGSHDDDVIIIEDTRDSDNAGMSRISDEAEPPMIRLPLKRLASPTFSDEDSTSSNIGHTSSSTSFPSTPPRSNQSTPSLRLYVSSSSSPVSSLSDSISPEWNPQSSKDSNKKKGPKKWKRKGGGKGVAKVKGIHRRGNGVTIGRPPSAKKSKVVLEEEYTGVEVTGGGEEEGWQETVYQDEKMEMDNYHQPQRKFASNHTPPVRYLSNSLGKVKECKKLPKTEDFISYLCLRGSGDIPKHLQKFASPWTPRTRKVKSTKNKNKGPKSKSLPVTSKKLLNIKSGP